MKTPENEPFTTEKTPDEPRITAKTKAELCKMLGFSPQVLAYHEREKGGFPAQDEAGEWDVIEVRQWAKAVGIRDVDPPPRNMEDIAAARLRLTKAEANLKEKKLAEMNRQLIPAAQVLETWSLYTTALRQKILSLGQISEDLRHEILEELVSIPLDEYFKVKAGEDDGDDEVKPETTEEK